MSPSVLGLLALAGFGSGFVDAIAGGGGLLTLPSLALAGLDPVAAVATNKLASTFGSGSATLAFWRAKKVEPTMAAPALSACLAAALGALALPWAPRALLSQALPVVLVGVALYFAFAPALGETQRRARMTPNGLALTLAPAVGFYDGVFGPGAGSFYMIGFVVLAGFGLTRAMAGARFANFGSNAGSLAIYAVSGHLLVPAGLAMGVGAFLGARLGARAALSAGATLIRPLIVVVSCAMAAKLMTAPGGLIETLRTSAFGG
jgi:uncharacterized membrane protein YfcA